MRVKWREFELPNRIVLDDKTRTTTYGCFAAEPFEKGIGYTLGNGLRRILLSSIAGAAVTSVRIKGVEHEFATIEGVVEDVTDIILNLKKLCIRLNSSEPRKLFLNVTKQGEVTAADFTPDPTIEIVNPELHIATLNDEKTLEMELTVKKGRGYVPAEEHMAAESREVGLIPIDAIYTPVTRVSYRIENSRVGGRTDYDRLVLEVWTKGTVTPEMAMVEAAKIYRKHINPFVQYYDLGREIPLDEEKEKDKRKRDEYLADLKRKLSLPISELDLSVRATNCLKIEKFKTIKDLVSTNEVQMLEIHNFGKTSFKEVKKKMAEMGLSFGMDLNTIFVEKKAE
ncbi:MAG: DNA-directed RNA polymerase subunit alpha [Candidatus Brocadiia bacterium]